jgi:hypothetical protein
MSDLVDRRAKFAVARRFVRNYPGAVAKFLVAMQFVPFRVEDRFEADELVYAGYSPLFPVCSPDCHAPEFDVVGQREGDENAVQISAYYRQDLERIVVPLPALNNADAEAVQ